MVLINTWNVHLKGIEAQKPLVLLFPGRCRDALTRLGASPGRLGEAELLYCEEGSGRTFKRQTTRLSLSDNTYLFGCALRSVTWSPSASAEYQLELDTRWSGQAILDAAQTDWRGLVARLASQIAVSNIPKEDFYALRSPTAAPLVWSARVRLPPEAGEKLLCGSGLESLFVRHADTEMEEQKKNYTVIWGPKHTDCSAQALTQLQQMSADFAGHRGIARSAIGLGLRVQWSDVAKARRALRPNDPCLNDANISIADRDLYALHGAPAAATAAEVSKFLTEIGWPAIVRSKIATRASTTWFVTAASEPPVKHLKWAEHLMFLEKSEMEELKNRRAQQTKKRIKAQTAWGATPIQQRATTDSVRTEDRTQPDPLLAADPWSRHASAAITSGGAASSSTSMPAPRLPPRPQQPVHSQDPRVDAVLVRLDSLESKSVEVDSHLSSIDTSIEGAGGHLHVHTILGGHEAACRHGGASTTTTT